jgi:hypothetical protein
VVVNTLEGAADNRRRLAKAGRSRAGPQSAEPVQKKNKDHPSERGRASPLQATGSGAGLFVTGGPDAGPDTPGPLIHLKMKLSRSSPALGLSGGDQPLTAMMASPRSKT